MFEGFEGADIAGEKGENGHSYAALPGEAEDGPLEEAGWNVFGVAGGEEVVVPGAGEVGEDDEEGGDSAEALLC